jgi:hypothetical protein
MIHLVVDAQRDIHQLMGRQRHGRWPVVVVMWMEFLAPTGLFPRYWRPLGVPCSRAPTPAEAGGSDGRKSTHTRWVRLYGRASAGVLNANRERSVRSDLGTAPKLHAGLYPWKCSSEDL